MKEALLDRNEWQEVISSTKNKKLRNTKEIWSIIWADCETWLSDKKVIWHAEKAKSDLRIRS